MNSRSKGISISFVYTILNTIIGLFMSAYVLRIVGKTEYGLYQTMTSFVTYLALFEFGTGTIMARNISLCKKDGSESSIINKNISTLFIVTGVQVIIIIFVAFGFYYSIDTLYKNSLTVIQIQYGKILFLLSSIKMVFTFCIQTLNGILLGFEKYSKSTIISLINLIVRTLLLIALLLIKPISLMIVIVDFILSIVVFIYTIWYCIIKLNINFSFKYFDFLIFKNAMPMALALFLQTLINMANGNVDKFVIGITMNPEAVSVYSIGMFIYTTFSSLTTIPITMYMPQVAKDMRDGIKEHELMLTLVQPCRIIFLIGGLVLFGFLTVGQPFISIVYGSDYYEAWWISIIVMIPMLVNMSNGIIVNVLDIMNKRLTRSLLLGVTTILNITLTVWWIKSWGIIGAAVATAISTILGQILLMNVYYIKVIKINTIILFKETFKGILPSFVFAMLVSRTMLMMFSFELLQFVIGGIVFVTLFVFCMYLFGANELEKNCIRKFLKKQIN